MGHLSKCRNCHRMSEGCPGKSRQELPSKLCWASWHAAGIQPKGILVKKAEYGCVLNPN